MWAAVSTVRSVLIGDWSLKCSAAFSCLWSSLPLFFLMFFLLVFHVSSVICSFHCHLLLLFLICSAACTEPSTPPPCPCFSSLPLSPGWTVDRGHAHSIQPRPHSSTPSFWHPLDLLLLLWSPTSVPQPGRCPPLCPPRPGPCPSVQPICAPQLAPPGGERRSRADLWNLLLSRRSPEVRWDFLYWSLFGPILPLWQWSSLEVQTQTYVKFSDFLWI